MNPYHAALAHYGAEVFVDIHEWHKVQGVSICTPRLFLIARPVWAYWGGEEMLDVARTDPSGDCWYIWWVSGDLSEARKLAGFSEGKRFVAFHRGERLVTVPIARFLGHS